MKKLLLFISTMLILFSTLTFAQFSITIDGERDDFYNTQKGPDEGHIYLPPQAYSVDSGSNPGSVEDEYDLSGLLWFAWDELYLYCYAEVWDDYILVNNTTVYENDALELKIDPDPLAETTTGVAAVRLSSLGEDLADEPLGVDNLVTGPGGGTPEIDEPFDPVEGEDYARKLTELGYNLEFRLPFDVIVRENKYMLAEVGSIFGLAVNLMENDDVGRETVLQWSAGMQDQVWSNPQLHGTVTFLEGNKVKMEPINSAGGTAVNDSAHWYIPPVEDGIKDVNKTFTADNFQLGQNYPNPFNPSTTIDFTVTKKELVKLSIFDILGHEVKTLVNQSFSPGIHSVTWDGRDEAGEIVASGVYFYRFEAGEFTDVKKLTFIQ
ncbi:T9SS type A sorting domain-containing protein [candidate division KSB1 bacterium]|nr:T9SS type A sorting domain-containing protein [candidate division KSB1 bacterium]